MATSSILGGAELPEEVAGKDTLSLGPSDNSDSGSDALGAYGPGELASDTDAMGTGERASVDGRSGASGADILPDHVEHVGAEPGNADDAAGDDRPVQVEGLAADDEPVDASEADEAGEAGGGQRSTAAAGLEPDGHGVGARR